MARTKFLGLAFAAMLLVAAVSAQDAAAPAKAAAAAGPAAAAAAAAPANAANAAPADAAADAAAAPAPKAANSFLAAKKPAFGKGGGPVHIPKLALPIPTFYIPMLVGKGPRVQRPQVNVTLPSLPVLPKPTLPTKGKGKGKL